tara:strand:+ start:30 stop:512 length:483 start_codon:yes stop_codon:yes gene_type:complete
MALIPSANVVNGNTIQASDITNIIKSLDGTGSYSIDATGSFTGSFVGSYTGSFVGSLTGTASYATSYTAVFPYTGSALITGSLGITGSLNISGSITGSNDTVVNLGNLGSGATAGKLVIPTVQPTSPIHGTMYMSAPGAGNVTLFIYNASGSAFRSMVLV